MAAQGTCGRARLAALRKEFVRALLVAHETGEANILHLVAMSAESMGHCQAIGVLVDGAWADAGQGGRALRACDVAADAGPQGGRIIVPSTEWAWAYPIPAAGGHVAFLIAAAAAEPPEIDRGLLEDLAQLAGLALATVRTRERAEADARRLRSANSALLKSLEIHDRLTQVTIRGEGQQGIARALLELTGHAAGIEDAFGNVVAWSGPGKPGSVAGGKSAGSGGRTSDQLIGSAGIIRHGERLISVARISGVPVGLVVLHDPARDAGEAERLAMGHATTALAMEVARMQRLGESLARSRSNLVLELLGGEEAVAACRAQAIGYDLGRPHRVVAVAWRSQNDVNTDAFFHGVRRAASRLGIASLIAQRTNDVIVLAHTDISWKRLKLYIEAESPGAQCSIGVGGNCTEVAGFPRSHRQAQLALRIQKAAGKTGRVTVFDELGVYQVLASQADTSAMESFVQDWLGGLIAHDAANGSQLVITLTEFLDCGGSHATTSAALTVHRSTLKYRLRRIREVSGHDLSIADTRFNLHVATRSLRTLQALRCSEERTGPGGTPESSARDRVLRTHPANAEGGSDGR